MKKNYLITGACGFIGSNFVNYMYNKYGKELNIVVLDKLDYCASINNINENVRKNIEIVVGDIGDTNLVMYILRKFDINLIINFSAYSHVDNSFFNSIEFTKNNVLQTHYLLENVRLYNEETKNITKFIHVSTDEVYGSVEDNKERTENSILDPTNPYASSKACAEMIVKSYWYSYKLPIIITRSNNVYGKNQYPEKLIPKFINHLINNEKLPIQGDGKTLRHYIHVDDVCNAFDVLIDKGVIGETYNISADKTNEYSVNDIATILLRKFYGSYDQKHIEYVKDRNFNDKRYYISSEKLEQLGWKCCKTNFIDELDDLIKILIK